MIEDNFDEPLTPYHLIHGRNLANTNHFTITKNMTDNDARNYCEKVQTLVLHFKKRFHQEYLAKLQERQLRKNQKFNNSCRVKVRDVVLIKDVKKPRMTWGKGRVEKLIEDKDRLVRVAKIKVYQSTNDKITTILRPLQLIVPLELCEFDSNELDIEPANQERNAPQLRRMAAVNADLIRQLNMTSCRGSVGKRAFNLSLKF